MKNFDSYSQKPLIKTSELKKLISDTELLQLANTVKHAKEKFDEYVESVKPQLDSLFDIYSEADAKYRQALNKYECNFYIESKELLKLKEINK